MLRRSVVAGVIRIGKCSLRSFRQYPVCSFQQKRKSLTNWDQVLVNRHIFSFMERDVSSSVKVGVVKEALSRNEEGTSTEMNKMEETENGSSDGKDLGSNEVHKDAEKYGYLERGYSTEMFKIELRNIKHHLGYKRIREYLHSLDLNPGKIKKPASRIGVVFINFKDEADRQKAISVLNGSTWKQRILVAKEALPVTDPLFEIRKRRKEMAEDSISDPKRMKSMTPEQRLFEAVCPWADIPYEKQLEMKEKDVKAALRKMTSIMSREIISPISFSSSIGSWLNETQLENDGVFCKMEPIKPSPVVEQYRNKCEYSVGYAHEEELEEGNGAVEGQHEEGQAVETEEKKTKREKVVGFRTGSYEDGDFGIVSPKNCVHLPNRMKELSGLLQIFFNESPLEPYSSQNDGGYWKGFGIRCYNSGETMVTVQMHPQKLSEESIESVKDSLKMFFTSGKGSQAPPTSLYFQLQGRKKSNEKVIYQHLLGEKHVHEEVLGMKYRIAPPSFFQVNTTGCGVLYDVIKEAVQSDSGKKTVILDLCCGTGTIGLYLSKVTEASKVVGIEVVSEAVEDAIQNAELNGVTNAKFVCGRVEDKIKELLLMQYARDEIVAILDPPRGGVHQDVIRAIRRCPAIKKLIYVACKPHASGAQHNIINLCKGRTNNVKGEPFRPVRAIPVDLFPHTPHCELVVVLERNQPIVVQTPESKLESKLEPETELDAKPEPEAEPEAEPKLEIDFEPKAEQ